MEYKPYTNMLFAMDLSLESTLMIHRAENLRKIFNGDLSIIHVIENPLDSFNEDKKMH